MLEFKKITLKSAHIGADSSLPHITPTDAVPTYRFDSSISESEAKNFGKGVLASIFPYKLQASYDRSEEDTDYTAAILENDNYKAVFLPELGGRLWSLFDKRNNRELLYCNDSVKVANLALCNGWFAGGVEWNVGVRGHSPYTMRPLFTQKVTATDGEDFLRMYEYEEIRGLCYAVEARLVDAGLAVHITVNNVKDTSTLMYWWSNIAAPQNKGTRIYVPTDKTFATGYREGNYYISKKDVPVSESVDLSNPEHSEYAADYFYDIPDDNPKWIASIEADGFGLLHHSDSVLFGRKTFLWGQSAGGQHWNEWLTSGRDYLEIQAGLSKTQFEHFDIPAKCEIQWNELYTGISLNATEYNARIEEINSKLPNLNGLDKLFYEKSADAPVIYGSARGYLAQKLHNKECGKKYTFTKESVKSEDLYYIGLLDGSTQPYDDGTSFVCDTKWCDLILSKKNITAFDYYILALISYRHNDFDMSTKYFEQSLIIERLWYVLAAYALLKSTILKHHIDACELICEASKKNPNNREVITVLGEIAIRANKPALYIDEFKKSSLQSIGRLRMYMGQCLVMADCVEEAKEYINPTLVVPDIREGEYAISNIWIMLYRKEMAKKHQKSEAEISDADVLSEYPIPKDIDFRMH